ncbi:MAG: hypothetical protein IJ735_06280 [Clostridia bacterium]|nr:hypothetical protein [Clostridia bacterium]
MNYVVPVVILLTLLFSVIKKVRVYDGFLTGLKESFSLVLSLLPYYATVFMLLEVFRLSGLNKTISDILAVPLSYIGIPKELCELLILRPLSGSGSMVAAEKIFVEYGVDSYVARCAAVVMSANDTVLYISAVYVSKCADKKTGAAIPISIFSSMVGTIVACLICRVL